MTWFRVDDLLPDHRKVRKAGTSAMGLWVLAGAWSAGHLTDGWVPTEVALRYGTARQAERLEAAGLWHARSSDGEDGWVFHQWTDHQPTREQVELRRKNAADRQANWRKKNQETPDESTVSRRDERVSDGVSNAAPVPTRPDPEEQKKTSSSSSRSRGTRIPEDFTVSPDMVAWARERTPHVDGRLETEKFINYWQAASGQKATKRDWPATWRNWMLNAEERAPRQQALQSPTDAFAASFLGEQQPALRALPGGVS